MVIFGAHTCCLKALYTLLVPIQESRLPFTYIILMNNQTNNNNKNQYNGKCHELRYRIRKNKEKKDLYSEKLVFVQVQ